MATPARSAWPRYAAIAAAVAALLLLGRRLGAELPAFAAWVDGLGAWGPAAFIAGYALAVVAFAPGSVLTLAAGAIFGLARGTAFAFVGAVIGSLIAFVVARYVARPWVEARIAASPKFAAIDRAIARDGLRIVLLLRLSPVVPFSFLNYALGLTRIRFVDALIASFAMLPGTLLYVYYGRLAGEVATLASGAPVERGAGYYAVLGLGLVATVVVTTLVTRIARRALREATEGAGDGTAPERTELA